MVLRVVICVLREVVIEAVVEVVNEDDGEVFTESNGSFHPPPRDPSS